MVDRSCTEDGLKYMRALLMWGIVYQPLGLLRESFLKGAEVACGSGGFLLFVTDYLHC